VGSFAAGQVAVLPFPFSDLTSSKFRPALLLADVGRGDWIACQVTSNPYADSRALALRTEDFAQGSLDRASFARPGKLFTAHESLFARVAGELRPARLDAVRQAVAELVLGRPAGVAL